VVVWWWETYLNKDLQNDAIISAEGKERVWSCGDSGAINAEFELL
jgi:hypothetical protein